MKNTSEISVRLFGGLGNQLFQYFAGLDLSIKSLSKLKIDTRWIDASYSQDNSDIRDFKLLGDKAIIIDRNSGELNFKIERLKTKISKKSQLAAKFWALHSPKTSGFVELAPVKPSIELRGFYQSCKYFDTVTRVLGKQDWNLEIESDLYLEIKSHLDTAPFIAIHVRGTDYLKKPNFYHRLDATYYTESLRRLECVLGKIRIIVFSDDIEYARRMLQNVSSLEFLDQNGLRASEAMLLMSFSKGLITANSTFSYWAAMINAGELITAPKYWYTDTVVDSTFYPPTWIIV